MHAEVGPFYSPITTCGDHKDQLGAFLGALAERLSPAAPDLAAVLAAWLDLPEPVKAGIMAMVKAVGKR